MESGEGFMSVMDHGVEVSIEHLPKIPCSKFTIIGNSRMRNKKPVRKKERMWKVPKGFRRHQTDQEKHGHDLKEPLKVTAKSLEPKFGNQEENNRLDRNGIYGDAFQRTLDLTHPGNGRSPAPRNNKPKIEKTIIDNYYRDKTSLYLPQLRKKNTGESSRKANGYDLSLPSLSKGKLQNTQQTSVTKSCQGNARHYCDVVGQRYCSACLRVHRLDKLAYRATEGGKQPHRNAKSKLGTALPTLRTGASFFSKQGGWVADTPSSNTQSRTKSSPLLSQTHSLYEPRRWERMSDLPTALKTQEDRKRRKVTEKATVGFKRLPDTLDITTDTESRHLNS